MAPNLAGVILAFQRHLRQANISDFVLLGQESTVAKDLSPPSALRTSLVCQPNLDLEVDREDAVILGYKWTQLGTGYLVRTKTVGLYIPDELWPQRVTE